EPQPAKEATPAEPRHAHRLLRPPPPAALPEPRRRRATRGGGRRCPRAGAASQERRAQARGRLRPRRHRRDIKDPEHPYSLEQLNVVTEDSVELNDESNHVRVTFTPTVEHCSMATVIGLCIRVKLIRSLPPRYKVDIRVAPGSHSTEAAVNKQLNDKERVAAALENPNLLDMVEECLSPTFD
ncbi:unnamed protein product, partial [Urochloa humidicola]